MQGNTILTEAKLWLESVGYNDQLSKLTGDASSRQYWRMDSGRGILCHDPNSHSLDDFIILQNYLESINIITPRIHNSSRQNNTVWLEDLGDTTLLLELSSASTASEYKLYKEAIDVILKLQSVGIDTIPKSVRERSFDLEKLSFEVNMTLQYFARGILKLCEETIKDISGDFTKILNKLVSNPQTFVHRDYHSRNLMIKDRKLVVIDFQDARMGLGHYDLVSLLDDCYIDISIENKAKLLDYFWENRNKNIYLENSFDEFMQNYHLMTIQRVFKAIGSFSYIYAEKGDIRYLKYIGFAVEKIRKAIKLIDLDVTLNETLLRSYYES